MCRGCAQPAPSLRPSRRPFPWCERGTIDRTALAGRCSFSSDFGRRGAPRPLPPWGEGRSRRLRAVRFRTALCGRSGMRTPRHAASYRPRNCGSLQPLTDRLDAARRARRQAERRAIGIRRIASKGSVACTSRRSSQLAMIRFAALPRNDDVLPIYAPGRQQSRAVSSTCRV